MVDDLLLLVAKLWGSFINEASNTHYDVNVPLTFNNLYLAISLDMEPAILTSVNAAVTLAVWDKGFESDNKIRFLFQSPKSYSDAFSYFAICR